MRFLLSFLTVVGFAQAQTGRFVPAVAKVRPAVVSIVTDKLRRRTKTSAGHFPIVQVRYSGSGFVLDTSGHILTCNHIVSGYERIVVELQDGTRYEGGDVKVVGRDPVTDLAVLQVGPEKPSVAAELGNSDSLRIGQWVAAVGNPFGLEGTATVGVISGLSRWGLAKSSGPDFQEFIQTDALINPGNSGGPLIDILGRVIGVSSFRRGSREEFTGIGFATPINLARKVAEQLIEYGKVVRGHLGVNTQPLTDAICLALGFNQQNGVLVASVTPGRSGEEAGIQPGDIILTIDGETIPGVRWFQNRVAGHKPGDSVRLSLWRKGKVREVSAGLKAWAVASTEPHHAPLGKHWLGLLVRDLTDADRTRTDAEHGVVIEAIEPGSSADDGNIRAGDVITEIDSDKIDDKETFDRIAAKKRRHDRPVLFQVLRGRNAFYTAVGH